MFQVPGLSLVGYTAEPNSPSAQAIQILASWIATEPAGADRDAPTNALD
ncbi:MAG TPA: hypothetical protein VE400_27630 [Mycobacterium sp.]|nr:hypothetical protein [Mycobacterium sp.]